MNIQDEKVIISSLQREDCAHDFSHENNISRPEKRFMELR